MNVCRATRFRIALGAQNELHRQHAVAVEARRRSVRLRTTPNATRALASNATEKVTCATSSVVCSFAARGDTVEDAPSMRRTPRRSARPKRDGRKTCGGEQPQLPPPRPQSPGCADRCGSLRRDTGSAAASLAPTTTTNARAPGRSRSAAAAIATLSKTNCRNKRKPRRTNRGPNGHFACAADRPPEQARSTRWHAARRMSDAANIITGPAMRNPSSAKLRALRSDSNRTPRCAPASPKWQPPRRGWRPPSSASAAGGGHSGSQPCDDLQRLRFPGEHGRIKDVGQPDLGHRQRKDKRRPPSRRRSRAGVRQSRSSGANHALDLHQTRCSANRQTDDRYRSGANAVFPGWYCRRSAALPQARRTGSPTPARLTQRSGRLPPVRSSSV